MLPFARKKIYSTSAGIIVEDKNTHHMFVESDFDSFYVDKVKRVEEI